VRRGGKKCTERERERKIGGYDACDMIPIFFLPMHVLLSKNTRLYAGTVCGRRLYSPRRCTHHAENTTQCTHASNLNWDKKQT
jgi:hypothetical protein